MRILNLLLATGVLAAAGCTDQRASRPATEAVRHQDAATGAISSEASQAPQENAETRTGPGESDRSETTLRYAETDKAALPSSAAPDIDSARGNTDQPE